MGGLTTRNVIDDLLVILSTGASDRGLAGQLSVGHSHYAILTYVANGKYVRDCFQDASIALHIKKKKHTLGNERRQERVPAGVRRPVRSKVQTSGYNWPLYHSVDWLYFFHISILSTLNNMKRINSSDDVDRGENAVGKHLVSKGVVRFGGNG